MARLFKRKVLLQNDLNAAADQLYPALTSPNFYDAKMVSGCLSVIADGLMFGHHRKDDPIYPTSMSFGAYIYMMPRFVFDPHAREVGDLLVEISSAELTDVTNRPDLKKLTTVLHFPIASVKNIESKFADVHRYYDGVTCAYTGKRVCVVEVALVPSYRMEFRNGTFKDYHRLLRVVLTTMTDTVPEMRKVMETFERVRRTDLPFYNQLMRVFADEAQADEQAKLVKPRVQGPKWFQPHDREGGHLRDGYLYFGDKHLADDSPHWVPINKLTHFLVSGMSGSGKSYFLHQVLEGIAHNEKYFDDVYLIDLKGGVELWKYNGTANGLFHVIYKYAQVSEMVEGLNDLMDERLDYMRENGLRDWNGNKVMVIIDEYAELSFEMPEDKEAKAQKQKMLAGLSRLSSKARAAGIIIWAQLQKGTTDVMDSGFRNNLQSEVMFCQKTKLQASTVFGAVDSLSVDPTRLQAGEFVMLDATTRDLVYLKSRMMRGL